MENDCNSITVLLLLFQMNNQSIKIRMSPMSHRKSVKIVLCFVLFLFDSVFFCDRQVGLLACYLMTFVMVAKPNPISCTLLRLGLGLSLSICYASIFTKANRISRIFNRGIKAMVKRPSYTSPRSQVVICMSLVSVQVGDIMSMSSCEYDLCT